MSITKEDAMTTKVVPREPTPEMCAKGFCVSEAEHDPAEVWRVMFDAAPAPAAPNHDYGRVCELMDEIERLRAELTALRTSDDMYYIRKWRSAEAERDALREDAERYRWIRKFLITGEHLPSGKIAFSGDNEGLDEIIDAARKEMK